MPWADCQFGRCVEMRRPPEPVERGTDCPNTCAGWAAQAASTWLVFRQRMPDSMKPSMSPSKTESGLDTS